MEELIKLVKTYRLNPALDQQLMLAEKIFRQIEPKLRVFVFSSVNPTPAPDVLQEVLKAIATNLRKFAGATEPEFWKWCYTIARNKISDHFRKNASDRLQTTSPDELRKLVDASISVSSLPPGARHDLEYAMKLLTASKPECHALLWSYYVTGLEYNDIADANGLTYDSARMKITRCLAEARALVA